MTADRFEWGGVGAALLFHVALVAALSLSLARANKSVETPAMEVDLVDEIALDNAAPQAVSPPPSAAAPMESAVEPDPTPAPPTPPPVAQPTPRPTPQPIARPVRQPSRPQPKPAPKPAKRQGLGDDFLSKLDDDLSPRGQAKPAAPTYSAKARASIADLLKSQAQRCADREPYIGEGADRITITVRLDFARSGRLARAPQITGMSGNGEMRAKYGELLEDQVRRIFTDCAPFRLPADLYETDSGGWKNTTIKYRVDK